MKTMKRTLALLLALGMMAALLPVTSLTARAEAVTVRLRLDAASEAGVTIKYDSDVITKSGISATLPDGAGEFTVTVEPDAGYEFSSPRMEYFIYSADGSKKANTQAGNRPGSTDGARRYTIKPITFSAYDVRADFENGGTVDFRFTGVKKIGDSGAVDFPADPTLPGDDEDVMPSPVTPTPSPVTPDPSPVTPSPVTPSPVTPSPVTSGFTDVWDSGKFYYKPVYWAVEKRITEGKTKTTFSPGEECTRGEVVTFLWRAFESPKVYGTTAFFDISPSAFYFDAIFWAVHNGVTEGTGPGTFSPENPCTRAQVVTFLYRACGSPAVTTSTSKFLDVPSNAYYKNAVAWAVASGITEGTGGAMFSPETVCTRGQVVTFLYRCLANAATEAQ